MLLDVRPDHLRMVLDILKKHVPKYEVWAFGSRAKWTAKDYSDLDLCIVTDQPLSFSVLGALAEDFSDSDLPWKVDVVDWATTSESFRKIIERDKVVVQKADIASAVMTKTTVGEIAAPIRNALVGGPFGSDLVSRDYVPSGVPVIRGTNMGQGRWVRGEFAYVTSAKADSLSANCARQGDIVFTQRGTLGQVALVPKKGAERYLISQSQMKLTVDVEKADALFLYYVFTSAEQQEYIRQHAIQTGVPHTNLGILRNTLLSIPPLPEQKNIAHILGTLDDKIELNRRMNETLESIARAIFKSWFVDFDPVRAKQALSKAEGASGEPPESICRRLGLTRDLLALFPDRFQDSELGEIPEGWEVTTLQSMTTKIGSGATPRGGRDVYLDEGTALIRSQNVYDSNFVWEGLAHISDEAAKQLAGVEVRTEDVLINITGASILRTCMVDPGVLPARVNQHVAIIRARPGVAPRYIHLHLLQQSTKAYLMGLNAGASREAVTKGHLESVPILNPGSGLLERFRRVVAPLYAEVEQLTSQSRVLNSLRDILLPKLLSGEIATTTLLSDEGSA